MTTRVPDIVATRNIDTREKVSLLLLIIMGVDVQCKTTHDLLVPFLTCSIRIKYERIQELWRMVYINESSNMILTFSYNIEISYVLDVIKIYRRNRLLTKRVINVKCIVIRGYFHSGILKSSILLRVPISVYQNLISYFSVDQT